MKVKKEENKRCKELVVKIKKAEGKDRIGEKKNNAACNEIQHDKTRHRCKD